MFQIPPGELLMLQTHSSPPPGISSDFWWSLYAILRISPFFFDFPFLIFSGIYYPNLYSLTFEASKLEPLLPFQSPYPLPHRLPGGCPP